MQSFNLQSTGLKHQNFHQQNLTGTTKRTIKSMAFEINTTKLPVAADYIHAKPSTLNRTGNGSSEQINK